MKYFINELFFPKLTYYLAYHNPKNNDSPLTQFVFMEC